MSSSPLAHSSRSIQSSAWPTVLGRETTQIMMTTVQQYEISICAETPSSPCHRLYTYENTHMKVCRGNELVHGRSARSGTQIQARNATGDHYTQEYLRMSVNSCLCTLRLLKTCIDICTYTSTHICTCADTYIHARMHAYMHTHAYTHTHACIHTHSYMYMYICTYINI